MVDSDVLRKFFVEVLVADPLVGDQQANLVRDGFVNKAFQRRRADVLDNAGDHVALAADCTDNNGFARTYAARPAAAPIDMSVFGFAADESFVHLDNAAKFFRFFDQRDANAVRHIPSSFERTETHVTPELAGAHPLFAGQDQVDDLEPVAERLIRVLKNRARNMRETVAGLGRALVALPMPRIALQLGGSVAPQRGQ